jgi:2-polyprenyl-3-methyl-5-hydroxy-6-metoxy-1,4-benzoquinol methylase
MANVYDLVRYPNWPIPETHPVALAAFAALFGRRFAPFHACRVLEIGCGEGVNLMSMALGAPASEFVGIDLAEAPIAQGRVTAQASGLANVTLRVQDLAGVAPGEFDYIIAHGVYAWVPALVRVALMRLIGKCLRPDGLAFVSYNVYPAAACARSCAISCSKGHAASMIRAKNSAPRARFSSAKSNSGRTPILSRKL